MLATELQSFADDDILNKISLCQLHFNKRPVLKIEICCDTFTFSGPNIVDTLALIHRINKDAVFVRDEVTP